MGNGAFATTFAARLATHGTSHYRVVDYRDAVPQLPWRNMFGENWTHTAPEIYYNSTQLGAWIECADATDKRCSAQWSLAKTLTHTCDHVRGSLRLGPSARVFSFMLDAADT